MFYKDNPEYKIILVRLIDLTVKVDYNGNGWTITNTLTFQELEEAVKYVQEIEGKMR